MCDRFSLTGLDCSGSDGHLQKQASATDAKYESGHAISTAPVTAISADAAARESMYPAKYFVRMGLRPHLSVSGKPLPSYGVGLFPTRLTCTGWEGCDSYSASDLGVYEAGDHVKVSISAAGAIQLHARGALIKTTDDGVAAGYDWYGIVALWTSGSWVDNVQLTYPQSPGEASWSSFAGAAGVRMPTEAPGARTCGTQYAGWLSTPHPAAGEPPTPGVVCFDADRGAAYKDCYLSAQVEVCACCLLYTSPSPRD